MSLIDVERAAVATCFGADAEDAALERLGDRRVWLLYREMVRKRLRGELRHALPRTLGAAGEAAVERAFVRHLGEAPPRSRFFHGVVGDFAASAEKSFRQDPEVAPHVVDLLRYEAAQWKVGDMDDRLDVEPVDLDFERRPLLAPAMELLRVEHAVHRGREHEKTPGEHFLCLHRSADAKKPRTWTLNAVTFDLMQRWRSSEDTISEAVRTVAVAREIAVDEKFIDGLCTVLADFIERGLLLGSR